MRPNNLLAWFYMVLMGQMFAVLLRAIMLIAVVTMIAIGIIASAVHVPSCAAGFVYVKGYCVVGYNPNKKP